MQADVDALYADVDALTELTAGTFIKENQLSEEQALSLIQKEENGRARKFVLKMLAAQARKAKRRRNLKQAQEEGILLPTV